MAKKAKVKIEVDDGGTITATTKKMDALARSTDRVTNANKGVIGTSGKAGKDFSRMASGMGGLVAAYATVAANVFALSAAFTVLKNAADFDSMIISSKNLEAATGASLTNIATRLQKATGMQITFAESVAATNKAIASGIDSSSLEQFTTLATKAAQTFGGSTTDALNRMIDAVLRGRTELVNKLGIVISADEAYDNFSASIGKTVKELTSFEKRMAITNIIIEKGNEALGETVIDPNPLQVLASTFLDLGQTILSFGTASDGVITKMLNTFNESSGAVAAFAGIIVASVIKKIIPTQADLENTLDKSVKRAAARAAQAKTLATQAVLDIKKAEAQKTVIIQNEANKRVRIVAAAIEKRTKIELSTSRSVPKSIQKIIKTGPSSLSPQEAKGALNSLNQNINGTAKNLTKVAKITKKELIELRTRLKVSMGQIDTWREKIIVSNRTVSTAFSKMRQKVVNNLRAKGAALAKFRADYDSTRLSILKNGIGSAFKKGNKGIKSSLGVISGGFTAILGKLHIILFAVGAGIAFWNEYGDSLTGVNGRLRELNEASVRGNLTLVSYIKNLQTGKNTAQDFADKGLKGIGDKYIFIGNAIAEITTPLNEFFTLQSKLLKENTKELNDYVAELENTKSEVRELLEIGGFFATIAAGVKASFAGLGTLADVIGGKGTPAAIKARLKKQGEELADASFAGVTEGLSKNIKAIEARLKDSSVDLLFNEFNNRIGVASKKSADLSKAFNEFVTQQGFVTSSNISAFFDSLNDSLGGPEAAGVGKILVGLLKDSEKAVITQGKNLGSLLDTIADSVKAVSTQNLEIVNSSSLTTQIKLLEKAKNQILTFAGTDKDLEIISKRLNEIFNLGDSSTFKEAQTAIEKIFNTIDKANKNIAIKKALKASIGGGITSLKISLKLATSDQERLTIIEKLNERAIDSLEAERSILQSKVDQSMNAGILKGLSVEQLAILESEAALAVTNLAIIDKQIKMEKRGLDIRKEQFRTLKAESKELSVSLGHQNGLLSIQQKIVSVRKVLAEVQKRELEDQISINKLLDNTQKLALKSKEIEDQKDPILRRALEIQKQNLLNARERLQAEKDITDELRRRNLQEESRNLQAQGDNAGAFIAGIKAQTIDSVNIADGSILKLAEGFTKGLREGLTAGFQGLLEGSSTIAEALKVMGDSLVATIAETLADQATSILMSFFEPKPIEEKVLNVNEQMLVELKKANGEIVAPMDAAFESPLSQFFTNAMSGIKDFFGFDTEEKKQPFDISSDITSKIDALISGGSRGMPSVSDSLVPDTTAAPIITEMKAKEARDQAIVTQAITDKMTFNDSLLNCLNTMKGTLDQIQMNTMPKVAGDDGMGGIATLLKKPSKPETIVATDPDNTKATQNVATATNNAAGATTNLTGAIGTGIEATGVMTQGLGALGIDVGENSLVGRFQAAATIANTAMLIINSASSLFGANGGVMSSKGFTPLANGGIATRAQHFVIGEGRKNEAVVPLPNNKEIPVQLSGGGEETIITNNYDFSGADPATEARIRGMIAANGKETFNNVFMQIDRGGSFAKRTGRR